MQNWARSLCANKFLVPTFLFIFFHGPLLGQTLLPEGFRDELVSSDWEGAVGIEFIDSSHWVVWERSGKVWLIKNGQRRSEPILDLSLEVMGSAEHGLLSLLIDPEFDKTGWIYLTYVVDPWVLRNPNASPYADTLLESWQATIGRLTRYQVDTNTWMAIDSSRKVLLGSDISSGIPILAPTHGIGGMCWGADSTILLAVGDGTTWVGSHTGGEDYQNFGFDSLGKADGIISLDEDLGSYRAQYVNSLSGKVLRLDRRSGYGLPSNPFYSVEHPNNAASKVWALGLRNPFRMVRDVNTGSSDESLGEPGTLIIGDVGRYFYEEINYCEGPANNFGWPSFEGFVPLPDYRAKKIIHPRATDLYSEIACSDIFLFDSLLRNSSKSHDANLLLCEHDTLPYLSDFYPLTHHVPLVAYGNTENFPDQTYVKGFGLDGQSISRSITDPNSGVEGNAIDGITSVAGDFYQGSSWPNFYNGKYFHGDFSGWIKVLEIDQHNGGEVHAIYPFVEEGRALVFLKFNAFDDCLYYVVLNYKSEDPQELRRICFGGDAEPVAKIDLDTPYGTVPVVFRLDGSSSSDHEGEIFSYAWVLGNDTMANTPTYDLAFDQPNDSAFNQRVTLVVADSMGQTNSSYIDLSLNNGPPVVDISSPVDGLTYDPSGELLQLELAAQVVDQEHTDQQLKYNWNIFLNHNNHTHLELTDTTRNPRINWQTVEESPFARYSYRIRLEVRDPLGLVGTDEVSLTPAKTTSINRTTERISVAPNPTTGWLTLRTTQPTKSLSLINGQGLVLQRKYNLGSEVDLDLTGFAPGLYIILGHLANGQAVSTQILLN